MSKVCVCTVGLVEAVLPLHHHAKVLIVQDEGLHLQLLYFGGGQLLAVHEETAVSINVDHHLHHTAFLSITRFDVHIRIDKSLGLAGISSRVLCTSC